MQLFSTLINSILTLILYLIILRIWMQHNRVNFYNQIAQAVFKVTQPIIGSLRKIIPSIGKFDTGSFVLLYFFGFIKFLMALYIMNGFLVPENLLPAILGAILTILYSFGHLIFWVLLARAILSWISQGQLPIDQVLYQLSEPLVKKIRQIIPPIGRVDISFMIFIFSLMIINIAFSIVFKEYWMIAAL